VTGPAIGTEGSRVLLVVDAETTNEHRRGEVGRVQQRDGALHDALLPGGTLVLDNEEKPFRWRVRDWSGPSGAEILLSVRVDAVDKKDRCVHMTIRAETADGRREEHSLTMRQWYRDELVPLLHGAGFATVDVGTGVDENTLVYVARRRAAVNTG